MTSADLKHLPDDGNLYELIGGELYVSKQPSWRHQYACLRLGRFLDEWNEPTGAGVANCAPGLIFADDDDVAPDLVWISREKLATALEVTRNCIPRLNWLWRFYRLASPIGGVTGRRNSNSTAGDKFRNTGS